METHDSEHGQRPDPIEARRAGVSLRGLAPLLRIAIHVTLTGSNANDPDPDQARETPRNAL